MRLAIVLATLLLAGSAAADQFPYVTKGPVVLGVSATEATVAWYTAHHQGTASGMNTCWADALTGTPNDTIPTLTLETPAGQRVQVQDGTCSRYHRAFLTGLTPGTRYRYWVDKPYPGGADAGGTFETAPSGPASFQFVVYGDTRDNQVTSESLRPDHQALIDAIRAREPASKFVIHTGDYALNFVAVSGEDRGYSEFFEVENALLSSKTVFPLLGNHETVDTTFFDGLLSHPKLARLAHPYYFSFDWGQAHVTMLDTFEGASDVTLAGAKRPLLTDEQARWAEADMAAARAAGKLLFVVSHQGAYSYGPKSHGGHPDIQSKIVPLMIKYGALGIFAGHDHYYERGREGCVSYLVVGAGGAPMYDPDYTAPSLQKAAKTVSYLLVTVDGNTATGVTKDTAGNEIDRFVFEPAGCAAPDAGMPAAPDAGPAVRDAGNGAPDAGAPARDAGPRSEAEADAGEPGVMAANETCGCSALGGPAWGCAALGAALLLRRT